MNELIKTETYQFLKPDFVKRSGLKENIFDREISFAVQQLHANPQLQTCDRGTIFASIMNVAQCGLTLNPVEKLAYLIPRYDYKTKTNVCKLDPSYMGLIKLLTDTGAVKYIEAVIIWKGDEIEINMADERKVVKHVPWILTGQNQGEMIGAYSIATLSDGAKHIEIMPKHEIDKIRDSSESWKAFKDGKIKKAIWSDWEGEMAKKSVIKRHAKILPRSSTTTHLQEAIQIDNDAHFREQLSHGKYQFIEGLINTSILEEHKKDELTKELKAFEFSDDADMMIEYLKDNQVPSMNDELTRKLQE